MPIASRPILEFPCDYDLRVIISQHSDAEQILMELVLRHVPNADFKGMTARSSRAGNYTAYVIHMVATSQQQLEALYQELNQHELVRISL